MKKLDGLKQMLSDLYNDIQQRWAQLHQEVFSYKLQILAHQMYLI